MANVYVRSGAGGAGTGADWANAYTTLAAAFTAKAAGDTFWVSEDHAETQASAMTMTCPGTSAAPCRVICVNHAGSVPPVSADLATTATISTTAGNSMTLATGSSDKGHCYYYGITFSMASGAASTNTFNISNGLGTALFHFVSCQIGIGATGGTNTIRFGGSANNIASIIVILENTTLKFGATSDVLKITNCQFYWLNTASALVGTVPTTLIGDVGSAGSALCLAVLDGVDLSAAGSGKTLVGTQSPMDLFFFNNCKFGASVTKAATPTNSGARVYVNISDSTTHNYNQEIYEYQGTLSTETSITRVGGAGDGAQHISWKLVGTTNNKLTEPFEFYTIPIWNTVVGSSVTATIHLTSTLSLNNDDVWVEVEYMNSTGTPIGANVLSAPSIGGNGIIQDPLGANAPLTTDVTSTWNGGLGGNLYQIAVSFTPQMAGPIRLRVRSAKASATAIYVDPLVVLS